MSDIEKMLLIAREVHPDLWRRTEAVARIIDPGAFMDDWVCHPDESAKLLRLKLKYQQSVAMRRAQEVLCYLGVNTETDWYEVLRRLAADPPHGPTGFPSPAPTGSETP